jgi:hypothetical protein
VRQMEKTKLRNCTEMPVYETKETEVPTVDRSTEEMKDRNECAMCFEIGVVGILRETLIRVSRRLPKCEQKQITEVLNTWCPVRRGK